MQDDGDLGQLRAAMDLCNRRLADVLHERARLAAVIGAWKRRRGMPASDAAREAEMLAQVLDLPRAGGFPAEALAAIFRQVFAASRALVEAAG